MWFPFQVSLPETPYSISPHPATMRVLPVTRACLPTLPCTGASDPRRTKSQSSHWCTIRLSFATYAAGVMGIFHVYSFVADLVPRGSGVSGLFTLLLPQWGCKPSTSSVLFQIPPPGPHAQYNGWLKASSSIFVRFWQILSEDHSSCEQELPCNLKNIQVWWLYKEWIPSWDSL